jgi:hypothetical protein
MAKIHPELNDHKVPLPANPKPLAPVIKEEPGSRGVGETECRGDGETGSPTRMSLRGIASEAKQSEAILSFRDVFVSLPKAGVTIPDGIASSKSRSK